MKKRKLEIDPDEELMDISICSCSLAARGLWSFMRLIMFRSDKFGFLRLNNSSMANEQLARMVGIPLTELPALLDELLKAGIIQQESGIFVSRTMICEENIRQKRAAGGKDGGNPLLKKKPLKKKGSGSKDNLPIVDKVNLPNAESGDGSLSTSSDLSTENKQEEKSSHETLSNEVNHQSPNPHESSENTHENIEESESPPLYIIFNIDYYINDKKEKEVWRKKLRETVLNDVDHSVRILLSNDFDLLKKYLEFEQMRKTILNGKKKLTSKAAKNILLKLRELAGGESFDPKLAIAIIEQSINPPTGVDHWLSFFPLQQQRTNGKSTSHTAAAKNFVS